MDDRFKFEYQWKPIYFRGLLSWPRNPDLFLDLYAYVSENETSFESESELVWLQKNLTHGLDGSLRELQTDIPISKVSKLGCYPSF